MRCDKQGLAVSVPLDAIKGPVNKQVPLKSNSSWLDVGE
jgi:hypothetical protein